MTDTKTDSPKYVVITGGNQGIGYITALKLLEKGYVVTISARSDTNGREAVGKLQKAVAGARVDYLLLDLASFASVRTFAKAYLDRGVPLHILINNAGNTFNSFGLTADGIEQAWQVNHLSHFLLTHLLWPRLKAAGAAGGARVVNVSSEAHGFWNKPFDVASVTQKSDAEYSVFPVYGRSKLANIFFTRGLESRLKGNGVSFFALHPGLVGTNLLVSGAKQVTEAGIDISKAISVEDGSKTSVYVATAPGLEKLSGGYFNESQPAKTTELAQSKEEEDKVWNGSLQLLGLSAANAFAA